MATFTASEEETNKVYDRQIRLWGADAQRRIQASRVLFLGLGPANVELVKNLVLAGFSATICDHRKVDAAALGYNFFADAESIGKGAAEASVENIAELNPFADVKVGSTSSCTDAATAEKLVAGHGVVIVDVPSARGSENERKFINEACRKSGAKFLAVRCSGDGAAAFLDLGAEHSFVVETGEGAKKTTSAPQKAAYCSYADAVGVDWNSVKNKKMAQPPPPFLLDRLDAFSRTVLPQKSGQETKTTSWLLRNVNWRRGA
jgi:ubiquitin-like 1-activating enzyme E1 A